MTIVNSDMKYTLCRLTRNRLQRLILTAVTKKASLLSTSLNLRLTNSVIHSSAPTVSERAVHLSMALISVVSGKSDRRKDFTSLLRFLKRAKILSFFLKQKAKLLKALNFAANLTLDNQNKRLSAKKIGEPFYFANKLP